MVIGILNHVDCVCWKLEIKRSRGGKQHSLTHHCVFAHTLQCQREMLCKGTGGADKLFLSTVTALVIVEEWSSVVSEVKPDFNSILNFSPIWLTRSPGKE